MRLLLLAMLATSAGCAHVKPVDPIPQVVVGPKQGIQARFNAVAAESGQLYVCMSSIEDGMLVVDCVPYLMFIEALENSSRAQSDL